MIKMQEEADFLMVQFRLRESRSFVESPRTFTGIDVPWILTR